MRNKLLYLFNLILDNDRKSLFQITKDLYKLRNKGTLHYFTCLMYKKNAGDIHDYLSRNEYKSIINNLYRKDGEHPILQNKNNFREFMQKNTIPISKTFGKIEKENLYVYDEDIVLEKLSKKNILENLVKYSKGKSLFIKQVDGEGGKSVFKFNDKTNFEDVIIDLNKDYIIEYELIQHDELNKINPYCINTLRVITVNFNGEIKVPDTFFRMGTGKSYVDNGSSGGIFVNYDIHQNKMGKVAYKLTGSGGNSYYKHPDTGFIFDSSKLPYPEKVIDLVTKAAKLFPDKVVIGWDVVFTPSEPIILEGNDNSHIGMMQISVKGLLSNEIYREVFKPYYKG